MQNDTQWHSFKGNYLTEVRMMFILLDNPRLKCVKECFLKLLLISVASKCWIYHLP